MLCFCFKCMLHWVQIVSLYGLEAENQLLRCLLSEAAKTWDERTASSVHASLLAQHLACLLNHPAKSTVICQAVDQPTRSLQKVNELYNSFVIDCFIFCVCCPKNKR